MDALRGPELAKTTFRESVSAATDTDGRRPRATRYGSPDNSATTSHPQHQFTVVEPQERSPSDSARKTVPLSRLGASFVRSWLVELLNWIAALGLLVAIAVLLYEYDGHPIPDWPFGITLGALVSLLASFFTFALMGIITPAFSQVKWLWFRKERKMADFEYIENASRGPMASLMLLIRGKAGVFGFAGALLTILMLAIAPFIQQIIGSTTQSVRSTAATIPAATMYDQSDQGGVASTDLDLTMKAAIMNGALNIDANATQFDVTPGCATGNCTYPAYSSLSMCYSCADLTEKMIVTTANVSGTSTMVSKLANGLSLDSPLWRANEGLVTMTINNTLNNEELESIAFKDQEFALIDMFVILGPYAADASGSYAGPYAAECMLQWCVQNYTATVRVGNFDETVAGKKLLNTDNPANATIVDGGRTYTIEYESGFNGMQTYFAGLLSGTVEQSNGLSPTNLWPTDIDQVVFHYLNDTNHSLDKMFDNIARGMTQNVRTRSNANHTITGEASVTRSIVAVQWAWIALPAALLLITLCFLLAVAVSSRNANLEPWKGNSIAALFHGFDSSTIPKVRLVNSVDEMQAMAERMAARLGEDRDDHTRGFGLLAKSLDTTEHKALLSQP